MDTNYLPYFSLIIFFCGIVTYAVIQFAYGFIIRREKETLLALLFSCAAFIYIISEASAIVFLYIIRDNNFANLSIMLNLISPFLFIIIGQYLIEKILPIKASLQKINRMIMWAAIMAFAIITVMILINPSLLIKGAGDSGHSLKLMYKIQDMGTLLIVRDISIGIYIFYCIINILLFGFRKKTQYPIIYTLAGLISISYFFSTYWYSLFFSSAKDSGTIMRYLPSISVIIFLLLAVLGRIRMSTNYITQLIAVKKDFSNIVYNDSALKIPNRTAFIRDINEELQKIILEGKNVFLLFLDIDNFNDINECYGEQAGDAILQMLSERLIELFSPYGKLYRTGGDEFSYILNNFESEEKATDFAGKIITCLRNPFLYSGVSYLVTASIGLLQIPRDGKDVESVLGNAYSIIRNAKKTKNTLEVFTQELLENKSKKIHIVNNLRNSINSDEFTLFYQPIVDRNKKIIYAEELLRYTGKDPSIKSPGVFIPILEEAGLMKEVDNMVIRKSFQDIEMKIKNSFSVSINLSTNQIVDPAYSDFLASFAGQHGIEKKRIVFEITEDRLIENISAGRDNIVKLKRNGFTVAIDDFGKGYSSLTYLAELPVDILKIDMEFVQPAPGVPRKEAMARHIIDLAHSLGLKVVAEGFEKQEQFDFFKSIGCDFFQGYYFGCPMALQDLMLKYTNEL